MKAAIASDDLKTVSAHFGMARHYLVYEIEGNVVKTKEQREKASHGTPAEDHRTMGPAQEHHSLHASMLSSVADCDAVIARGMGRPMYESIKASGKKAFVTRTLLADDAARALAEGKLDDHPELLH